MKEADVQQLRTHIDVLSKIKERLASSGNSLVFLTISGAHLYGFESEDSDVDYRGTFVFNTNHLLGLKNPKDVLEISDGQNDIVLFELRKEIGLALQGNCNVLEHINAKPIFSTAEYAKMKQLVNNSFGKNGLYNSYKGLAAFNYKKFILQGRNTVKKYLYVFRGLMAGIHVLQTGVIQPNIDTLNTYFKFPEVKQLIELKKQGRESEPAPPDLDTGKLEERINQLFEKIDEAYTKSKIPERPEEDDVKALDEFLKGVRRDNIR